MVQISEIEDKLLMRQYDSDIIRNLISLDGIGEYGVVGKREERIVDQYFDTQQGILMRNRSYLRCRSKNEDHFITFRKVNGFVDEITHQLNDLGIRAIIGEMKMHDILQEEPDYSRPTLEGVIESMGLIGSLLVTTRRILGILYYKEVEFGKIKFDDFCFDANTSRKHFEIEVTVYHQFYREMQCEILNSLILNYRGLFEFNPKSKYMLGMASLP